VSHALQANALHCIEAIASDIDFEYPATAEEGQGFADLVKELRAAFDDLATTKGDTTPYEITAAVSAGPKNYANLVFPQLDESLTYWNLMVCFPSC